MRHTYARHDGRRYLIVKIDKYCLLIGNSRWHWAIQKSNKWQFIHTQPDPEIFQNTEISCSAWAAVGELPLQLELDPTKRINIKHIPLLNFPSWVGIDRALGAWGAYKKAKTSKLPSSGLLIADAGTILSLTRITKNGEFAGGQLVPGLRLQLNAMAFGAHNLKNPGPENMEAEQFPFSTSQAMKRGSFQALIGTLIEAQRAAQIPLWLCGGDAPLLFKELKKQKFEISHHPNLVLEGMIDLQTKFNQD